MLGNMDRDDRSREELAEAGEHHREAEDHRREGAADRAEADLHRARGEDVAAAGDELEARGHDLASEGHERAAAHDRREAESAAAHDRREAESAAPEGARAAIGAASSPAGGSLLGDEHTRRFRSRWDDLQATFIDHPRESVAAADALVREATDALHALFERDRRQLEGVWDRGDEASTEDLRVTLQRYRAFFERLLTI